jgi:V8-like Glu-specific endopeptidase
MKKILFLAVLSFFISQGNSMDKIYKPASHVILKGFAAKHKPISHLLPKGFFIEEREGVVVKKIRENLLYVYNKEVTEKEFCLEDSNVSSKQFGLHYKKNNSTIDRRVRIENILDIQYMPICLLRGIYKVNDDHNGKLIYHGSGFRNSLNQIVTAGHNLYLEQKEIVKFCNQSKISLKTYDFDIDSLTVQLMFGVSFKDNDYYYVRTSSVSGPNCFVKKGRDFGILKLPDHEKDMLDNEVGSLPIAIMPNQPHEYMGQTVDIVGYPGEKNPRSLWYHKGHIKSMDPDHVVTYDVDTTPGNSGSPGFFALESESKDIDDFPVSLVHTSSKSPFNLGQGFDQDLLDFMEKSYK